MVPSKRAMVGFSVAILVVVAALVCLVGHGTPVVSPTASAPMDGLPNECRLWLEARERLVQRAPEETQPGIRRNIQAERENLQNALRVASDKSFCVSMALMCKEAVERMHATLNEGDAAGAMAGNTPERNPQARTRLLPSAESR